MKKVFFAFAIAAALVACNNEASTDAAADSTVKGDTAPVQTVPTDTMNKPTDSLAKMDSTGKVVSDSIK